MIRKSLVGGLSVILATGALMGSTIPAMAATPGNLQTAVVSTAEAGEQETDKVEQMEASAEQGADQDEQADDQDQQADEQDKKTDDQDKQTEDQDEKADDQDEKTEDQDKQVEEAELSGSDKPSFETTDEKHHPLYTEFVTIKNGRLADNFSAKNIHFDGVFKGSVIKGVGLSDDRSSFVVKFTKACDSKETDFDGRLLIDNNVIILSDGSVSDKELELYMYDTYRTADYEEKEEDKTTHDENWTEDFLDTMGDEVIKECSNWVLGKILPGKLNETFTDWLMKQGMKLSPDEKSPVAKKSEELDAIEKMSDHITQSTKDILGAVDKNGLKNAATDLSKSISAVNMVYENHNSEVNKVQEWIKQGKTKEHKKDIERILSAVYRWGNGNVNVSDPNMANFDYYEKFIAMGDKMIGQGILFANDNIFEINHGLSSYQHNYNTQTFAERRAYNQDVLDYYKKGYVCLKTAIMYDVQKNEAQKKVYSDEITKLTNLLNDKTMTKKARDLVNSKIEDLNTMVNIANTAIEKGELKLNALEKQKGRIEDKKKFSDLKISDEEKQPFVLCYRNNQRYQKALTVTESTPENFGVNGEFKKAGVNSFISHNFINNVSVTPTEYGQYTTQGQVYRECSIKDCWKNADDSSCNGTNDFKNTAVYKGNAYSDINYLNQIAKQRGLTLSEDLGTAFTYNNASAKDAFSNGISGFYNGGKFTTDKTDDGTYHCYEESFLFFWSKARYADYQWNNINHVVNYYDADGKAVTNTETRSFSVAAGPQGSDSDVPTEQEMYHGEKTNGKSVKLFLVNFYENK